MGVNLKVKDFLIGAFIGGAISLATSIDWDEVFFEPPFEVLEVHSFTTDGDEVTIDLSFRKNRCDLQFVEVFGESFNTWERLEWISNFGETGINVDPGVYDYVVYITLPDTFIDRIEVRTRHECEGSEDPVDSIFFTDRYANAELVMP